MGTTNSNDNQKRQTIGVVFAILFHAALFLILLNVAILNQPPDPPIQELLVTFEPDEPEKLVERPAQLASHDRSNEAVAPPKPAVNKPARAAAPQRAQHRVPQTAAPSGTTGDIERHEPETEEQQINPKALFQSQATDSPNEPTSGAPTRNDRLFRGTDNGTNVDSNASNGIDDGPSWQLAGRGVVGKLPLPEYKENRQGKVIVDITVDQTGKVINARAGRPGTTVQNADMWKAAEQAALKTKFTASTTSVQYGSITYIFKLK